MSVVVYSRLGDLLRNKKMSAHDLAGQIADQFGLDVDEHPLTRLAQATRVRRPDIELASAAAAILEAGLNDVFAVAAVPLDTGEAAATEDETDVLSPQQSYRPRELLYWQGISDAHLVLLTILPADECDRRGGMIVKGMGHGARDDTG